MEPLYSHKNYNDTRTAIPSKKSYPMKTILRQLNFSLVLLVNSFPILNTRVDVIFSIPTDFIVSWYSGIVRLLSGLLYSIFLAV